MNLQIREADITDFETIKSLEKEIFDMGYTDEFIEMLLLDGYSYLAFINNEPVGYILSNYDDYMFDETGMSDYMDEHYDRLLFTIISFGIKKLYRNQKIGTKLLDMFLKNIKIKNIAKIALQVRITNTQAIKLYQKFGFTIETVLKNYYTDPIEDAYLMIKNVKIE